MWQTARHHVVQGTGNSSLSRARRPIHIWMPSMTHEAIEVLTERAHTEIGGRCTVYSQSADSRPDGVTA